MTIIPSDINPVSMGSAYQLIGESTVENKFPLTLYRSTVSGAKVVIVDHPSFMLNAEISFGMVFE